MPSSSIELSQETFELKPLVVHYSIDSDSELKIVQSCLSEDGTLFNKFIDIYGNDLKACIQDKHGIVRNSNGKITIEDLQIDVSCQCEFYFQPEEKQTMLEPGCPASVEVEALLVRSDDGQKHDLFWFVTNDDIESLNERILGGEFNEFSDEPDINDILGYDM